MIEEGAGNGGLPRAASKVMLNVIKKREGSTIRFFVENLERARVTATFELGLVNMQGNLQFPCTLSFPPGRITEAFRLSPIDEGRHWTYSMTNSVTIGSNLAVHDDTHLYTVPFKSGKSFPISQGFGGSFSHSGSEKYAIDWSMPEGTEVLAARTGVVVGVKDDSTQGGPNRNYEEAANYVLIEHSDETIGNYAHLMPRGAKVKIGQKVSVGELIGYSGNTGFSSGPHLHFSVFRVRDGRSRESIPIRFREDPSAASSIKLAERQRPPAAGSAEGGASLRAVR